MIKSKISYWFLFRAIAYTVFFIFALMPIYLDGDNNNYTLNVVHFIYAVIFVIAGSILLTFLNVLRINRVIINERNIQVYKGIRKKIKQYDFVEICGMSWQNLNRKFLGRGRSVSINIQSFTIHFKDKTELLMMKKYYDNYEDLRDWFFSYCKTNNIIKIDPLEVRKRSRYRRPEKVKKL